MFSSAGFVAVGLLSVFTDSVFAEAQVSGKCSGQSCYVASLGATTNEPYKVQGGSKPKGGSATGDRCIENAYKQLGLPNPGITGKGVKALFADLGFIDHVKRDLGLLKRSNMQEFYQEYSKLQPKVQPKVLQEEQHDLEKRQACKANTLLFGRGTTEVGALGSTVGPALSRSLGSSWSVEGINYSADLPGIYCLGLPGGQKCVQQITKLVQRCPNTNIVLSGYSQGAMVARFCAAWAPPAAKKQIKGLALFGDPFNGADVKGVSQNKVKTWCNKGDGVCKGDFSIGAAHLSYTGSPVREATTWIQGIVKS